MNLMYPELSNQITMVMLYNDVTGSAIRNASGLNVNEYLVLKRAKRMEGARISEIAKDLRIAPSTISESCNHLVDLGFIRKHASENDKRAAGIEATRRGIDAMKSCEEDIGHDLDDLLSVLPKDLRGIIDNGIIATAISIGCSDYNESGFNLNSAYVECNSRFERIVTKYSYDSGASFSEYRVLQLLSEYGPLKAVAIGSHLLLAKATVSGIVASLLKKGFATENTNPGDRRTRLVAITPPGRTVLDKVTPCVIEFFTSGLKNTDAVEREKYGEMACILVDMQRKNKLKPPRDSYYRAD